MYGNNYMNNYPFYMPNGNAMPDILTQQKMQYQNMPMQTPNMPIPQQAPVNVLQNNDMIWVLSKTEAESYPVAPNNTVVMWDKNNPTIYVKSVDANRTPSFRTLDFTERTENGAKTPSEHICNCGGKYPKIEDFQAVQAQIVDILADIDDLKEQYKTLSSKSTAKSSKSTKGEE